MIGIAKGVAMWISATAAIPIVSQGYAFIFGGGNFGWVPTLLIWTLVFGAGGHLALRRTSFGRRVLATGGNGCRAGPGGPSPSGTTSDPEGIECTRDARRWVVAIPDRQRLVGENLWITMAYPQVGGLWRGFSRLYDGSTRGG